MRTTSLIRGVVAVCVGVGLWMLGATVARTQPAAPKTPTAELVRGQRVFLQHCAMCHGDHGKGDGELASAIHARAGVRVANLSDSIRLGRIDRSGVRRTVALGGAHTGRSNLMPAWGEQLTTRELEDVVGYVTGLPSVEERARSAPLRPSLGVAPGSSSASTSTWWTRTAPRTATI